MEGERWYVRPGVVLGLPWDDGSAVFCPESAQTLAISPLGAVILGKLKASGSGLGCSVLVDALAIDAGISGRERDELSCAVQVALAEFSRYGLVASFQFASV